MSNQTTDELARAIVDAGWIGRHTSFGPCEGYVYFVYTRPPGDAYVKVGFSRQDPRLRMASLQTGNHRHLAILSFIPGCRNMERHLHEQFRRARSSGEWFRLSDDVNAAIEKHITSHSPAVYDPSLGWY